MQTVPTCDDATTVKVGMSTSMLGWFGSLTPPPVGRRRREVISSANETTLNVAITVSNGQVDGEYYRDEKHNTEYCSLTDCDGGNIIDHKFVITFQGGGGDLK